MAFKLDFWLVRHYFHCSSLTVCFSGRYFVSALRLLILESRQTDAVAET